MGKTRFMLICVNASLSTERNSSQSEFIGNKEENRVMQFYFF